MQACYTCKPHAAPDALSDSHSGYWNGVYPTRHTAGAHLTLTASRYTHTCCSLGRIEHQLRCPHTNEGSVCAAAVCAKGVRRQHGLQTITVLGGRALLFILVGGTAACNAGCMLWNIHSHFVGMRSMLAVLLALAAAVRRSSSWILPHAGRGRRMRRDAGMRALPGEAAAGCRAHVNTHEVLFAFVHESPALTEVILLFACLACLHCTSIVLAMCIMQWRAPPPSSRHRRQQLRQRDRLCGDQPGGPGKQPWQLYLLAKRLRRRSSSGRAAGAEPARAAALAALALL